jgi:uncharacterized protein YecE (DUF72 family)
MKKLRDVEDALANFFAQGVLRLGKKLGPVLWQFSPRFVFDPVKLETFFKMLPRTMKEAVQIAGAHGPKLHGRSHTTVERGTAKQEIRHCVEIRPRVLLFRSLFNYYGDIALAQWWLTR